MKVTGLVIFLLLLAPLFSAAQKKDAEYYFTQGEEALNNNKYTLALAHLNECLRQDAFYWDAYPLRATAKESLGDHRGALTDYNIYIDSRPNDPDALLGRAVLRYQLGQYLPASEDFLKLLKTPAQLTNKIIFRQTPEGTDKMFTLQQNNHSELFNYLGLIEMRLKAYAKASVYLDSAVRLAPNDPQNYVNRGLLREHQQDTARAIADYQQALRVDPAFGAALHNLAVIERSRGQQTASLALLNQAITQSPSLAAPYSERAYYFFRHQQYKEALADYDKVISLNKSDEESHLYRGLVKEKLNDQDGAFIDFTEAISLRSDYARAWIARGLLLIRLKRLPEAVEDFSAAIIWFPDYSVAWYNRGIAYQRLGKKKDACIDFKQAESLGMKVDASLKSLVCH